MASNGTPHSNGSQFYITLGPAPFLDGRFQGIGRVVEGGRTLNLLGRSRTTNQRPDPPVVVSECGLYRPQK
jgi:peptidyl-prolyl cis-trans isomerase-like 6